ncbi:MAG TPA: hypothetical protein VMV77_06780 [Bacteroidales bacterium]|nr:hypothetical protein [Bacteroidales bacterium]
MSSFTKYYKAGDVITVPYFPHEEDKTQGESRWLICLEDLGDEIIAIPLKSETTHIKDHPKSFIIEKDSEDGKSMKLQNDSLVVPDRAQRIRKLSAFKHGNCSDELIDRLHGLIEID